MRITATVERLLETLDPRKQANSNRSQAQPNGSNELTVLKLRGRLSKHFLTLTVRFVAVGLILTGLGLGGSATIVYIKAFQALGSNVSIDLQLAAIGVINKILDLFVITALEHLAALMVTKWAYRQEIHLADLDLAQELTKPWKSLRAFNSRKKAFGLYRAGWLRLFCTLSCSTCLMFLGLAVNTVGIPKERWWPDYWTRSQHHDFLLHRYPRPVFQGSGAQWTEDSSQASDTLGDASLFDVQEAANIHVVQSISSSLLNLKDAFSSSPPGWYDLSGSSGNTLVALDTRYNGSSCGVVGQSAAAVMVSNYLINDDTLPGARGADGVLGILDFAWPSIHVICTPTEAATTSLSANTTEPLSVQLTYNSTTGPPNFQLSFAPSNAFTGATCNISLGTMNFPTYTNIGDNGYGSLSSSASITIKAHDFTPQPPAPYPLPPTSFDTTISQALARQFALIIPTLDRVLSAPTSNSTATSFLLSMARALRTYRPEFSTDASSLTPITTFLFAHLLSIAQWNMTLPDSPSPEDFATVRIPLFHIVGSGPRLLWEWAAAGIFIPILVACVYGLGLALWEWLVPGPWLKLDGMLVAASSSAAELRAIKSAGSKRELDRMKIAIREAGVGTGLVEMVAQSGGQIDRAQVLDRRAVYQWKV